MVLRNMFGRVVVAEFITYQNRIHIENYEGSGIYLLEIF